VSQLPLAPGGGGGGDDPGALVAPHTRLIITTASRAAETVGGVGVGVAAPRTVEIIHFFAILFWR